MWQLFVFLIGFVFCSDRDTDVETIAGKDVDLQCLGNSMTPRKVTITWTQSNNMTFLKCRSRTLLCEPNNTRHTFGRTNTFFSSTVTIRNVSLVHEDEYDISMVSPTNLQTCKINLTVNGELTTNSKTRGTVSKESHTITASTGYFQEITGSGTTYTTLTGPSDEEPDTQPRYIQIRLVISGCSGLVMLLILLVFVGRFIRSKKRSVRRSMNAESTEFRPPQGRRSLPPTPSDQSSLPTNNLPDQPPLTAQLFRPLPSNPPDIPMRPLVPVSEDAIRSPAEGTGSRIPGETFTTTDGRTPVTQAQKESDSEMEYDLLNISHHGPPGAVPHVYKETTNGLAEYALVSRQQVDKRIDQRLRHRSKQMNDDSEYDLLNTWNQAEPGTVPHIYTETTSGLAEYAVVSKPDDRKKSQSLGPLTKVMKAPIDMEAEYAVVDKSKKRAK